MSPCHLALPCLGQSNQQLQPATTEPNGGDLSARKQEGRSILAAPGRCVSITQTVLLERGVLRTNSPAPFAQNPHVPCPGPLPDGGGGEKYLTPFPALWKQVLSGLFPFCFSHKRQHLSREGRRNEIVVVTSDRDNILFFPFLCFFFFLLVERMSHSGTHSYNLYIAVHFEGKCSLHT